MIQLLHKSETVAYCMKKMQSKKLIVITIVIIVLTILVSAILLYIKENSSTSVLSQSLASIAVPSNSSSAVSKESSSQNSSVNASIDSKNTKPDYIDSLGTAYKWTSISELGYQFLIPNGWEKHFDKGNCYFCAKNKDLPNANFEIYISTCYTANRTANQLRAAFSPYMDQSLKYIASNNLTLKAVTYVPGKNPITITDPQKKQYQNIDETEDYLVYDTESEVKQSENGAPVNYKQVNKFIAFHDLPSVKMSSNETLFAQPYVSAYYTYQDNTAIAVGVITGKSSNSTRADLIGKVVVQSLKKNEVKLSSDFSNTQTREGVGFKYSVPSDMSLSLGVGGVDTYTFPNDSSKAGIRVTVAQKQYDQSDIDIMDAKSQTNIDAKKPYCQDGLLNIENNTFMSDLAFSQNDPQTFSTVEDETNLYKVLVSESNSIKVCNAAGMEYCYDIISSSEKAKRSITFSTPLHCYTYVVRMSDKQVLTVCIQYPEPDKTYAKALGESVVKSINFN